MILAVGLDEDGRKRTVVVNFRLKQEVSEACNYRHMSKRFVQDQNGFPGLPHPLL